MPANVESMFSVREMPWHREGTVIQEYPGNWDAARTLAGLDWEPVTAPVLDRVEIADDGTLVPSYIPGWNKISRSDTGKVLSLRPDTYSIIDHAAMGEIVEAVLAQPNVKWETAGVLDGGKAVWCLARLDEPIELPGDTSPTVPYLAITNRHDGLGACALRATAIRIVCANTFRAAEMEGERTGATFSFVHRGGWRDRIDEAREAIKGVRSEIKAYTELSTELLGIPVTSEQRARFITEFIPSPPETMITDRVARNIETAREAVRGILASKTSEGIDGTAYGLVQAAGEYLDHVRGSRSWETKLNRTLIKPEPMKARALKLVREVVSAS